jgi:hypothetical protein
VGLDIDVKHVIRSMFLEPLSAHYTLHLYTNATSNGMANEKCSECGRVLDSAKEIVEHFVLTGHQSLINPSKR